MTGSKHVYTATLLTDPPVVLRLDDGNPGSISIDTSRSPHVQATLRLKPQSQDVLDALDPRLSPRIRVDVEAEFPSGAQTRYFDLGIREQDDEQRATETVTLKSDEAILDDFVALADDGTPFTLAASLRDVIDYVLDKVIPGTALEASPDHDADVTPYWEVTNLMPNPAVRSVVGNWIAGGANGTLIRETGWGVGVIPGGDTSVTTSTLTTWSGNSGLGSGGAFPRTADVVPYAPISAGKTYTIYCYTLSNPGKSVRLAAQIFGADGQVLDGGAPITTETLVGDTWTLVKGTVRTPANASRISPFLYAGSGVQWTSGQNLRTTKWMIHEGEYPVMIPWFDGATPTDANYEYVISGDANGSATTRVPLNDATDPEALIWRAGQSAMDFLAPLVQAAGFRLVCDEERKWTLRDENFVAEGSLNVRFGVNLIAGGYRISRDSGLWFDAALRIYRWRDRDGIEHERIDSFALNDPPGRTSVINIDAAYPGPGRAEYAVRRAQGRGREVSATVVSDWRARAEQPTALRLEGAPVQVGKIQSVTFDLSTDRMTITDRTTETPEHAWILQPEGEWTTGPVGESWLEAS